jgi:methionyl-tRNA formyltransferase
MASSVWSRSWRRCRQFSGRAYNVLFFGSDHVALSTLQRLHSNAALAAGDAQRCVNALAVVCPAAQQHPHVGVDAGELPVRQFAAQHALPLLEKAGAQSLATWPALDRLASEFSVAVVVSFGYFLPHALLARFTDGAINMHPSLLPRYRGAAPIYHALLNGERETGVSIVTLDAKRFDAGRVLWQERVPILRDERYPELAQRLADVGAQAVLDTLRDLPARLGASRAQHGTPTQAPRVSRADARVRWRAHTVAQIWQRHCALAAAFGGVHTVWRGKRVKLLELLSPHDGTPPHAVAAAHAAAPGAAVFDRGAAVLWVRCADGWLGVRRVCVEGKHAVAARQFVAGYRLGAGDAFADPD